MSRGTPRLSVMLLTEDSGDDAFKAFCHLVKELLKQVDEHVQTQPEKIAFEPVRDKVALQALHANVWKSDKQRDHNKQVELRKTLATQIMLENGWAFFHFDGDRAWEERNSSENVAKFKELVWDKVLLLVQMKLAEKDRKADTSSIEAQARKRMTRLKQTVPFYSIESWLFQNTHEAVRLCEVHHQGRDVDQFQSWEQNRPALDEVMKPKEAVCLGAKHNLSLASKSFPAREMRAAGKSFAAAVQDLAQDIELCEALRRTWAYE